MNGVMALVLATAVSIDIGWQPLDEGGFEYIIQIEPQMLGTLEAGQAIGSQLPTDVHRHASYRIVVGNAAAARWRASADRNGTGQRCDAEYE